MRTLYKPLFEVKLLHEFYLTDRTGNNVFDLSAQADRLDFLFQKYESFAEEINNDLSYEVSESYQDMLKNYGLKLLPSYSGLKVLIEVKLKKLASGVSTFEPIHKLGDDLHIPVLIKRRTSRFDSISNQKVERNINSTYLFCNDSSLSGSRNFPYLHTEVANHDAALEYEQGELAKFGPNDIRAFYVDTANNKQWLSKAGKSFANENDRLLCGANFSYSFVNANNISKADFILKDHLGNIIQELHFKASNPFAKVSLAFDPKLLKMLPEEKISNELVYSLEVSGTGSFAKSHKVVFYSDKQELSSSIGVILIKVKGNISGYKLFDASGKLITRKNQFNVTDPAAPVFEINISSKASFWRYINNRNRALQNGLYSDLLQTIDAVLIAKEPRPLTANTTLFRLPDSSLFYLPNPTGTQEIHIENKKIYSDIMVPESDLFPLAP